MPSLGGVISTLNKKTDIYFLSMCIVDWTNSDEVYW